MRESELDTFKHRYRGKFREAKQNLLLCIQYSGKQKVSHKTTISVPYTLSGVGGLKSLDEPVGDVNGRLPTLTICLRGGGGFHYGT